MACEYKFCIRVIKYLSFLGQNIFILFSVHTTLRTLSLTSVGEPRLLHRAGARVDKIYRDPDLLNLIHIVGAGAGKNPLKTTGAEAREPGLLRRNRSRSR